MSRGHAFTFAIAIALSTTSCDGSRSHIFGAARYIPERDCYASTSAVDIVAGDDPGSGCAPTCLATTDDGGRSYYVTTECPPYPPLFEAKGVEPPCDRALGAWARRNACLADGGTANPADASPADAAD